MRSLADLERARDGSAERADDPAPLVAGAAAAADLEPGAVLVVGSIRLPEDGDPLALPQAADLPVADTGSVADRAAPGFRAMRKCDGGARAAAGTATGHAMDAVDRPEVRDLDLDLCLIGHDPDTVIALQEIQPVIGAAMQRPHLPVYGACVDRGVARHRDRHIASLAAEEAPRLRIGVPSRQDQREKREGGGQWLDEGVH